MDPDLEFGPGLGSVFLSVLVHTRDETAGEEEEEGTPTLSGPLSRWHAQLYSAGGEILFNHILICCRI